MRLQAKGWVEWRAAAGQPCRPAAPSPPVQSQAARGLPASGPAIPVADVNDLPKAPPIRRSVAAGGVRPARSSVAAPAAKAGTIAEGAAAPPSETASANGSPTVPNESAAAAIELPVTPPAPPPPADPLVKAVPQSIDEPRPKQ